MAAVHQHVGRDQQVRSRAGSRIAQSSPMPSLVHGLGPRPLALADPVDQAEFAGGVRSFINRLRLDGSRIVQKESRLSNWLDGVLPNLAALPPETPARPAPSPARAGTRPARSPRRDRSGRGRSRSRRRCPVRGRPRRPGRSSRPGPGSGTQRARQPGDADGRLAEGALAVEGPFAGQAEVGVPEPSFQLDRLDDEVDPRLEPPAGEGDQAAAEPAGGARAGEILDRDAQVALDDRREMSEVAVERLDHRGVGPFLRAVDGRAPRSGRRAGWSRRRRRRSRRRRARVGDRRDRSAPGGPGRRRRARARGPRRRAGESRGPGRARRRRRWWRCRRCPRSAPLRPAAIAASSNSPVPRVVATRGCGSRRARAPAPRPPPSRSRRCDRRPAGRSGRRPARPAGR